MAQGHGSQHEPDRGIPQGASGMDSQTDESFPVDGLLERLRGVRDALADRPAQEVQESLTKALQDELAGSPQEAEPTLDALRSRLVDDSRKRQERLTFLETERERLLAEEDRLKRENARLESVVSAAGPVAGGLEPLRTGLRRFLEGEAVSAEDLGLPQGDARLFRFTRELLRFVIRFQQSVADLEKAIGVGDAGEMYSVIFDKYKEGLKDRFRACLEDQEGSLKALKGDLERNVSLLVYLNAAHVRTLPEAMKEVLAEIAPERLLEQAKGGRFQLGANYEKAWKLLVSRHHSLTTLPPGDAYETYAHNKFLEHLSRCLDTGSRKEQD